MADPAHEQTDDMIEEIRQRVSREYMRAYEEAQAKLADYLRRFEVKDRIHAEAVRRGEETEADYREWRRGQILVGRRWQELVDTLAEDYRNADRVAASIVNGYAPDAYALNHDYATFQVEKGSSLDTSYTLYDRATVERLIRDQPDLLPAVKVDGKRDLAWNRRHIASAITQGVLQGESMDQVARRVRAVADMDYRAAMRTARTAMTSAQNAGRVDAYRRAEGMGIHVRKQWLATLDGRTRHSHRRLDGEVVGMDEEFSNGLKYPGDPESGRGGEVYNCRCTMVPVVDGVDHAEGVRHSNLGGVSYEEWRSERRPAAPPAPSTSPVPVRYGEFRGLSYVDDGLGAHAGDGSDLDPVRMVAEDTGFDDARARQAIQDVSRWVGNDYTRIRAHDPSTEDVRERLEEFLEASPKYEGTVWRGVGLERADADNVLQALRTGGEIDQRGVSSWATESDWAAEFAGMNVERRDDGVSIVFRLDENRSGVSIKHVASIDNDEVVAPEGARYVLGGEIEWVEDPYDGDYWLVPVREVY